MNIAPTPVPVPALTAEAPRPAQPPVHESSRPVIAPNASEAMAQETRRDDAQHTGHHAERKVEHDSKAHGQHTRRRAADSRSTPMEPATSTEQGSKPARNLTVGALLDVFA